MAFPRSVPCCVSPRCAAESLMIFGLHRNTDWLARFAYTAIWAVVAMLVPLSSFWAYTKVQGEELSIAVAFTALALFSLSVTFPKCRCSAPARELTRVPDVSLGSIRGPLDQIPGFGIRILQLAVSISRMESFLNEDEVAPHANPDQRRQCNQLGVVNATLRYAGAPLGEFALADVSVEFPEGDLTVVSGPTGSGKTSCTCGVS